MNQNQPWRGEVAPAKGEIHNGTMSLVGWSDAAFGGQPSLGKCRLGFVTGIMSSTLSGPCYIIQWTPKFPREIAKSILGGEVFAFSEMLGQMSVLREFFGHFLDFFPGMAGLEDFESLFARRRNKEVAAEEFLARHFLALQQAIGLQERGNACWAPGSENPAD